MNPLLALAERQIVDAGEFEIVRDVELADRFLQTAIEQVGGIAHRPMPYRHRSGSSRRHTTPGSSDRASRASVNLSDQRVIGGVAAVIALAGIGVDVGVLRERPQRLRHGGARSPQRVEARERSRMPAALAVAEPTRLFKHRDALRHGAECGQISSGRSGCTAATAPADVAHHAVVADFGHHRVAELALEGEIEVVDRPAAWWSRCPGTRRRWCRWTPTG